MSAAADRRFDIPCRNGDVVLSNHPWFYKADEPGVEAGKRCGYRHLRSLTLTGLVLGGLVDVVAAARRIESVGTIRTIRQLAIESKQNYGVPAAAAGLRHFCTNVLFITYDGKGRSG